MLKYVQLERNPTERENAKNANSTRTLWSEFLPVQQIRRLANICI